MKRTPLIIKSIFILCGIALILSALWVFLGKDFFESRNMQGNVSRTERAVVVEQITGELDDVPRTLQQFILPEARITHSAYAMIDNDTKRHETVSYTTTGNKDDIQNILHNKIQEEGYNIENKLGDTSTSSQNNASVVINIYKKKNESLTLTMIDRGQEVDISITIIKQL